MIKTYSKVKKANAVNNSSVFRKQIVKSLKFLFGLKEYERFVMHRFLLSRYRALPDFIIAGCQKGGSTSLFKYLEQNQEISTSFTKEVNFFNRSYGRGINFYKSYFPLKINNGRLIGESTPDYMDNPYVPKRIYKSLPNVKLIFVLRNPIHRAYSHYQMTRSFGIKFENLSFKEALERENERISEIEKKLSDPNFYNEDYCYYNYLKKGLYSKQLLLWKEYFPEDQLLILQSEELFENPSRVMSQTEDFLGVKTSQIQTFKAYNTRSYDKINNDDLCFLRDYYRKPNEELFEIIGKRFNWD